MSSSVPTSNLQYTTNYNDVSNQINSMLYDQNALTRRGEYINNSSTVTLNSGGLNPFAGGGYLSGMTFSHNSSNIVAITKTLTHVSFNELEYDKFNFQYGQAIFFLNINVLSKSTRGLQHIPMTMESLNKLISKYDTINFDEIKIDGMSQSDADYIRKEYEDGIINAFGYPIIGSEGAKKSDRYKYHYLLNNPAAVREMITFYGVFGNGLSEKTELRESDIFSGFNNNINRMSNGKRTYAEMYGTDDIFTETSRGNKKIVTEAIYVKGDTYFNQKHVEFILPKDLKERVDENKFVTHKVIPNGTVYIKVEKLEGEKLDGPKICRIKMYCETDPEPEYDDDGRLLTQTIGTMAYYSEKKKLYTGRGVFNITGKIYVNQ